MSTMQTQMEMEQPAKNYQVKALEVKLDQVSLQLGTILTQTSGLATLAQLQDQKIDLQEKLNEKIDDVKREVNAEYSPYLKRNKSLWALVGVLAVAIIGQAVIISTLRG